MGKLANNEAIKLRATYYNNLAVAVFLLGSLTPYFLVVSRFLDTAIAPSGIQSPLPFDLYKFMGISAVSFFTGLYLSRMYHRRAIEAIKQLRG